MVISQKKDGDKVQDIAIANLYLMMPSKNTGGIILTTSFLSRG
jgi:hypothetical protein